MKVEAEDAVKAVEKALDADACSEHMGDVWCAARNYMFGCKACLASFARVVAKVLNKKRKS